MFLFIINLGGVIMGKNEINVMDELNKGATMGMDAIKFVLDKISSFAETLLTT